jgi:hypothetical protein
MALACKEAVDHGSDLIWRWCSQQNETDLKQIFAGSIPQPLVLSPLCNRVVALKIQPAPRQDLSAPSTNATGMGDALRHNSGSPD